MSRKNKKPQGRTALAKMGDEDRFRFIGTFKRFGMKSGWKGREVKTLLLTDVRRMDTMEIVTDHLWFTCGVQFEKLKLREGMIVAFNGRVAEYWKGYMGYREDVYDKPVQLDWKISYPTKVEVISEEEYLGLLIERDEDCADLPSFYDFLFSMPAQTSVANTAALPT